jgi:polyisoprenoid-binding protein YceI
MRLLSILAILTLSACAFTADETPRTRQSLPVGQYQLEKDHASLFFRVKHLGLSYYTVRLASFDATLDFDPANPANSKISALIDTTSVRTEHPTDKEWDARLSRDLLRSNTFPQASFSSTHMDVTGANTGRVTVDVTYNGGMAAAALYAGRPAIGFSARGTFKRSDFGSTRYSEFVSDDVEIVIEAEFTRR